MIELEIIKGLIGHINNLNAAITIAILVIAVIIIRTKKSQQKESIIGTICVTIIILSLIFSKFFI